MTRLIAAILRWLRPAPDPFREPFGEVARDPRR